jgi:cytochrome c oxidase accessory protein FixG
MNSQDLANESKPRKIIPIKNLKTDKPYPRSIKGYFAHWRTLILWVTQILFYGVAWMMWGDRQAVWFNIPERIFYIFHWQFAPQDMLYFSILLMIAAYSLFAWTTVAGRVWCGFSCPQTVYTEMMLWIEAFFEGDRNARIKLDAAPWSAQKIARKTAKHTTQIALAAWTGFTFVGYFTPIRELFEALLSWNIAGWSLVWILIYGGFTYLFAAILREKVCQHMCPYARFQSVMMDANTLVVTYDVARGEPREKPHKPAANNPLDTPKAGDCIDCGLCVQVCPVGIDIREGLQYECISCGLCIDACDSVMVKQNKPKGLIRYASENQILHPTEAKHHVSIWQRPRALVYIALILILTTATLTALFNRVHFSASISRDRQSLSRITSDGLIENTYQLNLKNLSEKPVNYTATLLDFEQGRLRLPDEALHLAPQQSAIFVLKVQTPEGFSGSHPLRIIIHSDQGDDLAIKASFLHYPSK